MQKPLASCCQSCTYIACLLNRPDAVQDQVDPGERRLLVLCVTDDAFDQPVGVGDGCGLGGHDHKQPISRGGEAQDVAADSGSRIDEHRVAAGLEFGQAGDQSLASRGLKLGHPGYADRSGNQQEPPRSLHDARPEPRTSVVAQDSVEPAARAQAAEHIGVGHTQVGKMSDRMFVGLAGLATGGHAEPDIASTSARNLDA